MVGWRTHWLGTLMVAALMAVGCSSDTAQNVKADSPTTSSPGTTTSMSASTTTVAAETTTVVSPATSQVVDTTTTTAPDPCFMSTDMSCGDLQWDPPNAPLLVTVTAPDSVAVGEPIYVTVVLHDDDDQMDECGTIWGDDNGTPSGELGGVECPSPSDCVDYHYGHGALYGTWPSPPSSGAGDATFVLSMTGISRPGTFSFILQVHTRHAGCSTYEPHGSAARATFTVVVQ